MAFHFEPLEISDVVLVHPEAFSDVRGFFLESYRRSAFRAAGIPEFVQDNHSQSGAHVLRGLHYQLRRHAQGKLVRVISGSIFDVAVDLRSRSPTFGKWIGKTLSAANRLMLYIPPGFAHGFLALSEGTEVLYKTTDEYAPESERGICWNDATIGIGWPVERPILSPRDNAFPLLRNADNDF